MLNHAAVGTKEFGVSVDDIALDCNCMTNCDANLEMEWTLIF